LSGKKLALAAEIKPDRSGTQSKRQSLARDGWEL
jgi:hypothetical protein